MKLSVALCTYNGEKYISKQLLSIINQNINVSEIVICDDCSSDNTVPIINKIQSVYPGLIKLHCNEHNIGAISSFEKCIKLCSGEIIFLSDQDDIWHEDKVDKFLKKFNSDDNILAIFSDGELIDDMGNYLNSTLWDKWKFTLELQEKWHDNKFVFSELLYNRNVITGATLAFKKQLLSSALPFVLPVGYWHDAWIGLVSSATNSLSFISEPTISYRIHSQQQVGITAGAGDRKYNHVTHAEFFRRVYMLYPRKRGVIYPSNSISFYIKKYLIIFVKKIKNFLY